MIVDLLRNDLGRVCRPGSVRVPSLFDVEAYPTVWQMTSTVTGESRPGLGLGDLFGGLFPCGSITGAPKIRTMALITELEDRPRGVYCGAVGVVFPGGAAAFNVAIRTLVVDQADGRARYDVGGGVVWDSDGRDEHAEALAKAAVLDMTQRDFALLETLRVETDEVVLLDRHVERMARSAEWFGWPFDPDRARALVRSDGAGPARARLLLRPSGDLRVEFTSLTDIFGMPPAPDRTAPPPRAVVLARSPVWSGDPWLRHKSTRRGVYERHRREATAYLQAAGWDAGAPFDVLLWNERGELTELTIGNLVADVAGTLVTPPVACGLLPGTLRAHLLASGTVSERVLRVQELPSATALWLVNAVRGWVPITLVEPPRQPA